MWILEDVLPEVVVLDLTDALVSEQSSRFNMRCEVQKSGAADYHISV